MKTLKGLKLRQVADEMVISAETADLVNFNKIIALNESAALIWQKIENTDFSVDSIAQILVDNYNIDHAVAAADAQNLVNQWIEAGIVA